MTASNSVVELDGIAVRQGAFALGGVSFAVPAGRYAVLTGRTGSGKTTLLEVVAGLRRPTAGRVLLRGEDVTRWSAARRGVGYVPQDAALFTAMTVRENLGFALSVRGAAPHAIAARVAELAGWLGVEPLLDRRTDGLSGGEAQRVSLGRALAFHPDVLLLDEPLAALDDPTRDGLIEMLQTVRRAGTATVIHVTHSRTEAEQLADVRLELAEGKVNVNVL